MKDDKREYPYASDAFPHHEGLTRRELFAAMAMQGLASTYGDEGDYMAKDLSVDAVVLADALIAELDYE